MAAPVAKTRLTPSGIPLQDGYQSEIAFTSNRQIGFWEKNVTPPSLEGGEPVNTTTMQNATHFTKAPRQLIDYGDTSVVAGYDPLMYTNIKAMINVRDTVTITFPDGSTLAFFGFLRSFTPSELVEGTMPEATIVIVCTNWDHANNVEAAPVLTEVSGT